MTSAPVVEHQDTSQLDMSNPEHLQALANSTTGG